MVDPRGQIHNMFDNEGNVINQAGQQIIHGDFIIKQSVYNPSMNSLNCLIWMSHVTEMNRISLTYFLPLLQRPSTHATSPTILSAFPKHEPMSSSR